MSTVAGDFLMTYDDPTEATHIIQPARGHASVAAPRILVVGSINIDIVALMERLPAPGETVTGGTLLINHGGKGANQAVAARRLGAEVRFIGCVGDDTFGQELRQSMAAEGIRVDGLATIAGVNSGTGVIVVDAAGRNQIAVASGANMRLTVDWVARFAEDIAWAQVVVCQLEVPLDTVLWTLRTARHHGAITVLNPAPAQPLPPEIWPLVDYLTPNEIEAAHLSGLALTALSDADDVAQVLLAQGLRVVSSPSVRREPWWVHLTRWCMSRRFPSRSSTRRLLAMRLTGPSRWRWLRGVRSRGQCALRMLQQGLLVHNAGRRTRSLAGRRWMPC